MKIGQTDIYKSLNLGETYTNKTGNTKEVQISYINAMGLRQNSFSQLKPGETITKTDSTTIIHIFY